VLAPADVADQPPFRAWPVLPGASPAGAVAAVRAVLFGGAAAVPAFWSLRARGVPVACDLRTGVLYGAEARAQGTGLRTVLVPPERAELVPPGGLERVWQRFKAAVDPDGVLRPLATGEGGMPPGAL
jgi:hypothetical protein